MTVPGEGKVVGGSDQAKAILKQSADVAGDPWGSYKWVKVSYDGEWTGIVKRLQPDLVDGDFRKSSDEVYNTRTEVVNQVHRGPGGKKDVERSRSGVLVSYNGQVIENDSRVDASALVADAYTAFLFGPSWLMRKGENLKLIGEQKIEGEVCDGVQGVLRPGFGFSEEDRFIAWISRENKQMRRLQFTIDGLASTKGSDVEVTFSEYWKASDGSLWPGRFVEWVQRPVFVKAHEWTMTRLSVDGSKLR